MPFTTVNGIRVHYEVHGSGPPILMSARGGSDSTLRKWKGIDGPGYDSPGRVPGKGNAETFSYVETFSKNYQCIIYDRRECGESGGRVERLSWWLYAYEMAGLLDHLNIDRAFVWGRCLGCTLAVAFGVAYPSRTLGLVLQSPAGGPRWRIDMRQKWYGAHALYAAEGGLKGVVDLAREKKSNFMWEPLIGPWGDVIAKDEEFARRFVEQDLGTYVALIGASALALFDRDTFPGFEPEELMALKAPTLIVPGDDWAHAHSAARYLKECLPKVQFVETPVAQMTQEQVRDHIGEFLGSQAFAVR